MGSFSQRHGYIKPPREVRFRDDLPIELRQPIIQILHERVPVAALHEAVTCLFNPYGLDFLPELAIPIQAQVGESQESMDFRRFFLHCPWYHAYDVIEEVLDQLAVYEDEYGGSDELERWAPLQDDLNRYFLHAGIGWHLERGKLVTRGDDSFQGTLKTAESVLRETSRPTSADHIRSALSALSERPEANTSGAVFHATNAVESLLHDITGESMTLGEFLKKHSELFHPALQKGLNGIYGFASDSGARHGKEGTVPTFEHAKFAVAVCAATCTLLTAADRRRTTPKSTSA